METLVNVILTQSVATKQPTTKNLVMSKVLKEVAFIAMLLVMTLLVNSVQHGIYNVYRSLPQKDPSKVAIRDQNLFLDLTPLREKESLNSDNKFKTQAIVKSIAKRHNNLINTKESTRIVDSVINQIMGDYHGDIPVSLALALIEKESTFNAKASSYDGSSFGAMQVNYRVWKDFCNLSSPNDLKSSQVGVRCGLKVLSHYLERSKGNIDKALMAYRGSTNRSTNIAYVRDIRNKMSDYRKIVRTQ